MKFRDIQVLVNSSKNGQSGKAPTLKTLLNSGQKIIAEGNHVRVYESGYAVVWEEEIVEALKNKKLVEKKELYAAVFHISKKVECVFSASKDEVQNIIDARDRGEDYLPGWKCHLKRDTKGYTIIAEADAAIYGDMEWDKALLCIGEELLMHNADNRYRRPISLHLEYGDADLLTVDYSEDVEKKKEEIATEQEEEKKLTAALTHLTPLQAKAIDLYIKQKKTQAQVGEEMGISQQAADRALKRAYRVIKENFK